MAVLGTHPVRRAATIMMIAGCVASLDGSAAAQSVWPPDQKVGAVLSSAKARRIAVIGIGDSNQLFNTAGWDQGWTTALAARYGIWGSGLLSAGEAQGFGSSVGYGCNTIASAPQGNGLFQYTQAPADLEWFMGPGLLDPQYYLYVEDGAAGNAMWQHGMVVSPWSGMSVQDALTFHFAYGMFPGSRGFNIGARVLVNQNQVVGEGFVDTEGAYGAAIGSFELPAGPRYAPVHLFFGDAAGYVRGPMLIYLMQAENPGRTTGAAVHTLYGSGGKTARDMGLALMGASRDQLRLYFTMVRAPLGENPKVIVRINAGANDRGEWHPSLLSNILPGNSGAAYKDNVLAIMTRIRDVWDRAGWDTESELYFVLTPTHAVWDPEDPAIAEFRVAARELAEAQPNTAAVTLPLLASEMETSRNGWYNLPGDHYHLNAAGVTELSIREVRALVATECREPADINDSGQVETEDLREVLGDFGLPMTPGQGGDLTADGIVGTADLVWLLQKFGDTTCNNQY